MVRRIWEDLEDVGNMTEMLPKFFFNKKRHWIWRLSSTHGNQSYLLQSIYPDIPSTDSHTSFSQSYQHNKTSGKPEHQGSSELSGWRSPLTHQRNALSGHGIMFGTMNTLFLSVSLHSAGPDSCPLPRNQSDRMLSGVLRAILVNQTWGWNQNYTFFSDLWEEKVAGDTAALGAGVYSGGVFCFCLHAVLVQSVLLRHWHACVSCTLNMFTPLLGSPVPASKLGDSCSGFLRVYGNCVSRLITTLQLCLQQA